MSQKILLVIIPDYLSVLIKKGEYIPRYYNPGNLFDSVHIVMTNDDQPNFEIVQGMVGQAELHLHNLPMPSFIKTLGRQPFLIRNWIAEGIELARNIQPDVIRTHGNFENGYLASQIKKALHIPFVTSIHNNPDVDKRARYSWIHDFPYRLAHQIKLYFEIETLKNADYVLPVYEPIREYAEKRHAKHIKVLYNVINPEYIQQKANYSLHTPAKIISVGRQFEQKNPDNLIRAIAKLADVEFTIVGDGPIHQHLVDVAKECNVADRIHFHKSIPNHELCTMLPHFDIFATHTDFYEISKAVLEPLLTGMPIILNQRIGKQVPELQGDWVMLVENTVDSYYQALHHLLTDDEARENLGRRAYNHAQERYAPAETEAEFVKLYQSLLN